MEAKRKGGSALGVGGDWRRHEGHERLLGLSRREGILRNTATSAATSAASASAAPSALVQAGRRAASGLRLLEEHVHKRFRDVLRSDRRVREPWVPAQCALGGRATAYIGQAAVHRGQPEGCFRRGSILCLSSRHGRGRGTHRGGVHVCNRRRQSDTGAILRPRFFSH
jgi:hypothetical protein